MDLSLETKRLLEALAVEKHGNQSAVLREAVMLYQYVKNAQKEGKALALVKGDQVTELHIMGF